MKSINRIQGALVVWIISYLFFLLTLVTNFSASHDSIHYLIDIVGGKELFHQHHLLYNFLASKWLAFFRGILPGVAEYYIIEAFTAIWGSSALSVIYLFFRNRFFLPVATAVCGTAVIAFSYGFWFYSVNIEVYLPPLFFILWTLYLITKKETGEKDISRIAVLHSLAILFHQVNILFAVVVLYFIIINRHRMNIPKALIRYVVIGVVIAGGMYFLAGWVIEGHHSLTDWIHWMEGYTVGHGYWQSPGWQTPLHVITGFSHAFLGGHFLFQLPSIEHYLQHSFASHGLQDEIFLSANISPALAWALTVLSVIFSILFVLLLVRFAVKYKIIKAGRESVLSPLLLCIGVYSLFFCFWMPEILEFWILQMVLIWLVLIGTLPLIRLPFRIPLQPGLFALMIIMFMINFFGSIRWLQDINNDWYYRETEKIKDSVGSNDLIIVENEWILKDFIRYFTKATVIATDEPDYNETDTKKRIEEVEERNGKVYVYRNHAFIRSY